MHTHQQRTSCSTFSPVLAVVHVWELSPHFAGGGTEAQRGKGFVPAVTGGLPLHLLPAHLALTARRLGSHFPTGPVPCPATHLQGEASLMSHLSKHPCRGDSGTKGKPVGVAVSLPLCGWLGDAVGRASLLTVGHESVPLTRCAAVSNHLPSKISFPHLKNGGHSLGLLAGSERSLHVLSVCR